MTKFTIQQNKLLKNAREKLGVKSNDELFKVAGSFYATLAEPPVGAGIGTTVANVVRKGMKAAYDIPNLRPLTNKDGLTQLPYSNYIGPGTDLESANKHGPVTAGPASVKGSHGLSADEIAKIHDHEYEEANKPENKDKKYKMIQEADLKFLTLAKELPTSKTRSLVLQSIQAKYILERARGKLVGGTFVRQDKKNWLQSQIEAIINDFKVSGELTPIKTLDDKKKDNLEIAKKDEEEKKIAAVDRARPSYEASSLRDIKFDYGYYQKHHETRDVKIDYLIFFPKDPSIPNTLRPAKEWIKSKKITDHSTGDTFRYVFPIYESATDSNEFRSDFFAGNIVLERDGGEYKSLGSDLMTAIENISQEKPLVDIEKELVKKYGLVDEHGFYAPIPNTDNIHIEGYKQVGSDYVYKPEKRQKIIGNLEVENENIDPAAPEQPMEWEQFQDTWDTESDYKRWLLVFLKTLISKDFINKVYKTPKSDYFKKKFNMLMKHMVGKGIYTHVFTKLVKEKIINEKTSNMTNIKLLAEKYYKMGDVVLNQLIVAFENLIN